MKGKKMDLSALPMLVIIMLFFFIALVSSGILALALTWLLPYFA